MAYLVKVTEQQNITVRDYWRQFTVKDALRFIKESWEEVPRSCLNGVWKKLCPSFVHDFKGFNINDNLASTNSKSLRLAQQVGFENLESEDIDKLLNSHQEELSNEELLEIERERVKVMEEAEAAAAAAASPAQPQRALTATNLTECLNLLRQAMQILEENDPNVERSSSVIRGVMNKMACYEIILKEKQQHKKQQSITSFFQPKTPATESETDDPDTPDAPNTTDTEAESADARRASDESEAD